MARDLVFDWVRVQPVSAGGNVIYWGLYDQFLDPDPWTFFVDVGATGNPLADDWAPIAGPLTNVFTTVDSTVRSFGVNPTAHYRVRVETPTGEYVSQPASIFGILDRRDWLRVNALARRWSLKLALSGSRGWLLKRRRAGAGQSPFTAASPATAVLDPITGDIVRHAGDFETYGTGFQGGYFAPAPCYFDVAPFKLDEQVTLDLGNSDAVNIDHVGTVVFIPPVSTRDVFVSAMNDIRYEAHGLEVVASWRGVPVVSRLMLRQLPFGDVSYNVPLPTWEPPP